MGFYGDDTYSNDSYGIDYDIIYTGVEIYEKFLTYLTDYRLEFGRIIIENGENRFTVFPPNEEEPENFVIYEGRVGSPRFSGTAQSVDELLEEAIEVVGEEKIKVDQKGKHI